MAWGGGLIPLTSLTIAHAVLYLNIAAQDINKALPNYYRFYIMHGGGPKFVLQLLQLVYTIAYRPELI